jgi:hypothetical protein
LDHCRPRSYALRRKMGSSGTAINLKFLFSMSKNHFSRSTNKRPINRY